MTKEAFAEQVVSLRSTLFHVSYSLLPNPVDQEDAVQECIHKGLLRLASLRDEKAFKSWIIRILINECYNVLRRKKREIPTEEIPIVAPEIQDTSVFEAVMALEERLRLPFVLHYVEGYTTREASRLLRVPEGTLKSRLGRARQLLRDVLGAEEGWTA